MTPQGVGDMNPIRVFLGYCLSNFHVVGGAYVVESDFASLMKVVGKVLNYCPI